MHPPTSCQTEVGFSPTAHHFAQRSPGFPRDTRTFLPSQKSQETFYPTPSVLGVQEHLVSTPEVLEALSSFQKPKVLSRAEEGPLPMQSSFIPNQRNLENSTGFTGILSQYKESQSILGHFQRVREDVTSSQSTSSTLRTP